MYLPSAHQKKCFERWGDCSSSFSLCYQSFQTPLYSKRNRCLPFTRSTGCLPVRRSQSANGRPDTLLSTSFWSKMSKKHFGFNEGSTTFCTYSMVPSDRQYLTCCNSPISGLKVSCHWQSVPQRRVALADVPWCFQGPVAGCLCVNGRTLKFEGEFRIPQRVEIYWSSKPKRFSAETPRVLTLIFPLFFQNPVPAGSRRRKTTPRGAVAPGIGSLAVQLGTAGWRF